MIAGTPVHIEHLPAVREFEAVLTDHGDGNWSASVGVRGDAMVWGLSAGDIDGAVEFIAERLRTLAAE